MIKISQRCAGAASEASLNCAKATERLAHAPRRETQAWSFGTVSSANGLARGPSQPGSRRATHARGPHLRCAATPARSGASSELPQDWTQVVAWAREEFRRCVGSPGPGPAHTPDSAVHLAKACLLVALEEEAARSGDGVHPELTELVATMTQLRPRSTSSASTWSGERLEALAAEVAAVLDGALEERAALEGLQHAAAAMAAAERRREEDERRAAQGLPPLEDEEGEEDEEGGAGAGGAAAGAGGGTGAQSRGLQDRGLRWGSGSGSDSGGEQSVTPQPSPSAASDEDAISATATGSGSSSSGSSSAAASATTSPSPGSNFAMGTPHSSPGSATGAGGSSSSSNLGSPGSSSAQEAGGSSSGEAGDKLSIEALSGSFDFEAEQEQLLDRIHSNKPGAVGGSSRSSRTGAGGTSASRPYYGAAWPVRRRLYGRRQALYRRYPVQTLAAVNEVLFDRHGYQPCNRYGVPSDHQLAAVLEGGVGASAALSILYLEVCERLGFPLAARPLEDGRYFVVWPLEAPLTADGQRFLVDPYGRGGLLLLEEVCEIFGVEEADLLQRPASRRELLAALLGELRDAHWAAAAGCPPNPGAMTPLSAATALENKVQVPSSGVRAASLRRALAAAEKRLWLLPDDPEAQLQYGLLQYFSRRYDDAWIELSLYLERFAPSSPVAATPAPPGPAALSASASGSASDSSAPSSSAVASSTNSPAFVTSSSSSSSSSSSGSEAVTGEAEGWARPGATAASEAGAVGMQTEEASVAAVGPAVLEAQATRVASEASKGNGSSSSNSSANHSEATSIESSSSNGNGSSTCMQGDSPQAVAAFAAVEAQNTAQVQPPQQPETQAGEAGGSTVPVASSAASSAGGGDGSSSSSSSSTSSGGSSKSTVEQQVRMLVEKIRLELDFAPAVPPRLSNGSA